MAESTRQRLLSAALEEVGRVGYAGATTRAMAAAAAVSEVTLFRHFATKQGLVAAALASAAEDFTAAAAEASNDLEADLTRLATGYAAFASRRPRLVWRMLAEAASDSEIGRIIRDLIATNAGNLRRLVEHHQGAGRLPPVPADQVIAAFLGPVLTQAALDIASGGDGAQPFDPEAHVRRFLNGFLDEGPGLPSG